MSVARGPRVVVWRHGRTEWNATGRFQGQLDVALDEVGEAQARRAAALLAALQPNRIVSSDLSRARATAEALGRVTGLPVEVDADLRETYAGKWQGLTGRELDEQFPEERALWHAGDADVRVGGGECRRDVGARMAAAITRYADAAGDDGLIVLATHGGAARLGIANLVGLPPQRWVGLGALSNCSWSILRRDRSGWVLLEHNAGTLPVPVTTEEG